MFQINTDSGIANGVRGVIEGFIGRAIQATGVLLDQPSLEKRGKAQADKARAQRDVAVKEAEADKARATAKAKQAEQDAHANAS